MDRRSTFVFILFNDHIQFFLKNKQFPFILDPIFGKTNSNKYYDPKTGSE
ncbi:MAG: hypothetical protein ACI7YS_09305 [Flavobacterium sp.]